MYDKIGIFRWNKLVYLNTAKQFRKRHDTQYNDTQNNDFRHNDTQYKVLIYDTQHTSNLV